MRWLSLALIPLFAMGLWIGPAQGEEAPVVWDKVVDAEFDDADLRDAVTGILDRIGASYSLPDNLYGRVTARLSGISARHALTLLLEPRGWDLQTDGTLCRLVQRPKPAAAPALQPPPQQPAARVATVAAAPQGGNITVGGQRLAVIRLRHMDPTFMAGVINGGNYAPSLNVSPFQPLNALLAGPRQGSGYSYVGPPSPLYGAPSVPYYGVPYPNAGYNGYPGSGQWAAPQGYGQTTPYGTNSLQPGVAGPYGFSGFQR